MQQKNRRDMEFQKKLKNFDEVWQRVSGKEKPVETAPKASEKKPSQQAAQSALNVPQAKGGNQPGQNKTGMRNSNPYRHRGHGGR